MYIFPIEILVDIASYLPLDALRCCRLTSRRLSSAAATHALKHLYFLDTVACTREFESFVKNCGPALLSARSLTLYYGEWPICTQDAWEIHPLQRYEMPYIRAPVSVPISSSNIARAYRRYRDFIDEESARSQANDVRMMNSILAALPNVQTIILRPMRHLRKGNPQLTRLVREIWLSPSFRGNVGEIAHRTLLSCGPRPLRELHLYGSLNFSLLSGAEFATIQKLCITSPFATYNEDLASFLSLFPNLEQVELDSTSVAATLPIELIRLSRVATVNLSNLWISETGLLRMITNHRLLQKLVLRNITLSAGLWASFFYKLWFLQRHMEVVLVGTVDGVSHQCPSIQNDRPVRVTYVAPLRRAQSLI